MKKLIVSVGLVVVGIAFTGCTGASFAKGFQSIADDHANQMLMYGGIYGPVTIVRENPMPGQSVSYDPVSHIFTTTWTGTNMPSAK